MAFSQDSENGPMSEINVTPLVDVMLVLLVVFMVTAPLLMQAVPVTLPKTAPVAPLTEPRAIKVTIDAQGAVFVDQRPVGLDGLPDELRRLLALDREISVQVYADDDVRYGRVAAVMAVAQRAGIDRLAFITTPR